MAKKSNKTLRIVERKKGKPRIPIKTTKERTFEIKYRILKEVNGNLIQKHIELIEKCVKLRLENKRLRISIS